jgi:hypothetical protein
MSHEGCDVQRFHHTRGIRSGPDARTAHGLEAGTDDTSRRPPQAFSYESVVTYGCGDQRREQLDRRSVLRSSKLLEPRRLKHDLTSIWCDA